MNGTLLTPKGALEAIADAPGVKGKSAEELRQAAEDVRGQADRKDRLHVNRASSKRRRARETRASKDADRLHAYAAICAKAAEEVDRRKAITVEEALLPAPRRWARRLSRLLKGQS